MTANQQHTSKCIEYRADPDLTKAIPYHDSNICNVYFEYFEEKDTHIPVALIPLLCVSMVASPPHYSP